QEGETIGDQCSDYQSGSCAPIVPPLQFINKKARPIRQRPCHDLWSGEWRLKRPAEQDDIARGWGLAATGRLYRHAYGVELRRKIPAEDMGAGAVVVHGECAGADGRLADDYPCLVGSLRIKRRQ